MRTRASMLAVLPQACRQAVNGGMRLVDRLVTACVAGLAEEFPRAARTFQLQRRHVWAAGCPLAACRARVTACGGARRADQPQCPRQSRGTVSTGLLPHS